jgi:hypothetical protein
MGFLDPTTIGSPTQHSLSLEERAAVAADTTYMGEMSSRNRLSGYKWSAHTGDIAAADLWGTALDVGGCSSSGL